jgi:hypothetical protein
MKLMYCAKCATLVVPNKVNLAVTRCSCRRFAVWWRDGGRGLISVHDSYGRSGLDGNKEVCFLLGINNNLLGISGTELSAADYQALIDATPETYMFKTRRSLIVRFVPGHSSDSMWADEPPDENIKDEDPRKEADGDT